MPDRTERLTLREWAAELSPEHKRLSLEEATLFCLISVNDRLVEIQGRLEDLAGRYQLLDRYLERAAPGYRHPDDVAALRSGT